MNQESRIKNRITTYHLGARSFTLIEILIASSIFTAIMVLMIGAFSDSLAFQGSSRNQRVVRQSTHTFMDFLARQLRQVNTLPISIDAADTFGTGGGVAYSGTGYLIINGYDASGRMRLPAGPEFNGTAIIFPLTETDANGYAWMYFGVDPNTAIGATGVVGLYKGREDATDSTKIRRRDTMEWQYAGQFLPSEVDWQRAAVYFKGINPKGIIYDNRGNIASYNTEAQPYVTVRMRLNPVGEIANVLAYQTSLTTRDYKFAFPTCSKVGAC